MDKKNDYSRGSQVSKWMRIVLTSLITAAVMLVFILLFDYLGVLRSQVVQLPLIACTAWVAALIAQGIVERISQRPS